MSYPINQQISPYQQNQPSMGFNTPGGAAIPNVNSDNVTQGITQNTVLKNVGSSGDDKRPWLTPLLTVPVGAGMIVGMSKFNEACRGSKDSSLLGRMAAKGDKISEKISGKISFIDTIANKFNAGGKFLDKNVVSKSRILDTFSHAPTTPKASMVRTMAGGSKSEIAGDAISKLQKYLESGNKLEGTTKEELEELSKKSHTQKGLDRIVEICEKNKDKCVDGKQVFNLKNIPLIGKKIFKNDKYLSDYIKPLKRLGSKVEFSEYVNKIEAFTAPQGKSALGRAIPKATIRGLEGITNGTAGGKLAVLMGAYFVADAIKKGIEAPKGEKIKTFTENLFYNAGWYLTMPLGIRIMHGLGGLRHIGMGKGKTPEGESVLEKNLENYKKKLEKFNAKAAGVDAKGNACETFKDKDAYKAAKKALTDLEKGDGRVELKSPKTWFKAIYKPIRGAAKLLSVGLETKNPYISKEVLESETLGSKATKFAKNLPKNFKKGAGYPVRFGVFMFLIAPPLAKIAAKVSHVIFGKPTKSVLDEDKESETQNQQAPLIMPQQTQSQVAGQTPVQPQNVEQGQVQTQSASGMQPVAAQNNQNLIDDKSQQSQKSMVSTPQPAKRYIPSSEPVKINPNQNPGENAKVDAAIDKSIYAVKGANKYLPEGKQDKN